MTHCIIVLLASLVYSGFPICSVIRHTFSYNCANYLIKQFHRLYLACLDQQSRIFSIAYFEVDDDHQFKNRAFQLEIPKRIAVSFKIERIAKRVVTSIHIRL